MEAAGPWLVRLRAPGPEGWCWPAAGWGWTPGWLAKGLKVVLACWEISLGPKRSLGLVITCWQAEQGSQGSDCRALGVLGLAVA